MTTTVIMKVYGMAYNITASVVDKTTFSVSRITPLYDSLSTAVTKTTTSYMMPTYDSN